MFISVNNQRFPSRPGHTEIEYVIVEIASDTIILDQDHVVKVSTVDNCCLNIQGTR